ncbi:hypothetical protein, partial [Enterococcus faecium]|uniref:hypothetical protein n=1 Tax=Enterococcus faecium TaxID=1352 RepID=UPI003DA1B7E2
MNIPVEKRNTLSDKYFPEYAEDGTDLSDDEILIIYKAEHPPLPTTVEYKEVDSLKESYRNACLVALEFGYIQCEKGYNI